MKYYYTDPLKAAWMVKEHRLSMEEAIIIDIMIVFGEGGLDYLSENDNKYYVDVACYDLLEPQVGDLCYDGYGDYFIVRDNDHDIKDATLIIQRDGSAFFTPEVEDENA